MASFYNFITKVECFYNIKISEYPSSPQDSNLQQWGSEDVYVNSFKFVMSEEVLYSDVVSNK